MTTEDDPMDPKNPDAMDADRQQLDELLTRRALEGLDEEASQRLETLLARHPDLDPEWVDRVVGELDAAGAEAEQLDEELRAALIASGAAATPAHEPHSASPGAYGRRGSSGALAWGGWFAAAAAAVLWLSGSGASPTPPPAWDAVASADAAVIAAWEPGGDAAGDEVAGEVAWDAAAQTGVMRLAGLAANTSDDFQYQLWIFDSERDARYPVDGGVFDVPAGAETIDIPIRAALPVEDPTLFAVTVERPGGVVVSDRSRIVAMARIGED